MSESTFSRILPSGEMISIPTLEEAAQYSGQDGYLWLDFYEPDKDDLLPLIDAFGVHPLSIEDCLDESQVPKIEDFDTTTIVLLNSFHFEAGSLAIEEIDFILSDRFLITVSGHGESPIRPLKDIRRVVQRNMAGCKQGPDFLMHTIIDLIVDQKFTAIEALEENLNDAEERLLRDVTEFQPEDLLQIRRDLLTVRKSLFHEREILVKICRKDCPFIDDDVIYHFRDVYDHLARFFELTETARDTETSLMEIYLSMLSNQMAKSANETNITVRRLTFITTIFMPLTLLAGVGGMSEWSMMTGPENWRISYPLFILAMALLGVASYHLLKWFDRRRGD